MSNTLVTQLDTASATWIEQKAQRTGLPIDVIVRQLIQRGIELERQQLRRERHHDLDSLAGTWSDEESDLF
jgi:hypothetical protein